MSRTAEEALALEERIRRMKLNSERLQKRHLEVEEDKLHAAQQNALVQVVAPPGNDWVIRNRSTDFEYIDNRSLPQPAPLEGFGEGRGRGRTRGRGRGEPRRNWSNEHDDRADDEPRQRRNAPVFEQRSGRERWAAKTSPHGPGNAPFNAPCNVGDMVGNSGNMVIGNWEDPAAESRRPSWRSNNQGVIPSKVFSNTSLEGPPSHKAKYRLAEGDGPPPDPSYSFLGDSMRDGNRMPDRRKENLQRGAERHRPDRGPGGRTVVNHGNKRSTMPMSQQSYEEWRRERDAIDQRRISRQKTSDGHWSREWDNDKVVQNDASPPRYSSGETWGNSRRRYNNRFGDFLDDSFQKRPRTRSNQGQLNTSGSSDSRSPEKESTFHDQRNSKGRQPRRQFSGDNHVSKSSYESPPSENRRCVGMTVTKPLNPSARLEAARRATGPVVSSLRQYDSDVCTLVMPCSSAGVVEDNGVAIAGRSTPDKDKGKDKVKGSQAAAASPSSSPSPSPTLKVSVTTDETGRRTRIVEGVNCPDLTPQPSNRDSKKNSEVPGGKKTRLRMVKTRKKRVSQSSLSKEEDESWEDLSSEDDISFVADLPGPSTVPLVTQLCTKSQDVSSGPESLDPIPPPNKEEELLWEEFHPAGFQNNMTLAMVTETAYKALLSKGEAEENPQQRKSESEISEGGQANFAVDPVDKSEEGAPGTMLDPILVVTQIVKAEVDCMSLTSVTDSSLPDDINVVPSRVEAGEEELPSRKLDAEELSGPVSILEITARKGEASSDNDGAFQSTDTPKSQVSVLGSHGVDAGKETGENINSEEVRQVTVDNSECLNNVSEKQKNEADDTGNLAKVEITEGESTEDERIRDNHIEDERIEDERIGDERIGDERIGDERIGDERIGDERIGDERIEDERIEDERIEDERIEDERIEDESIEDERAEEGSVTEDVKSEKLSAGSNNRNAEIIGGKQDVDNLETSPEKSETLNGESLGKDSKVVSESREKVKSERVQGSESVRSDLEKSDDKDTSVAIGDTGASNAVEKTADDSEETKSDTISETQSEGSASQSSEMNR